MRRRVPVAAWAGCGRCLGKLASGRARSTIASLEGVSRLTPPVPHGWPRIAPDRPGSTRNDPERPGTARGGSAAQLGEGRFGPRTYKVGYEAQLTIRRSEFGMGYGIPGVAGDEVRLIIALEANRPLDD